MTKQVRPSVIDENVPVFEGHKARRYSDGYDIELKVKIRPLAHCAICNKLTPYAFYTYGGYLMWRKCQGCIDKRERESIIILYQTRSGR